MNQTLAILFLVMLCPCADAQKLPTVAILSTGGTIASKQDPLKRDYLPALSGEDLVAAVPGWV
jgi:L-asparaginase/Glu-tRNA(Gln) amidotransferase subunit D